MSSKFQLKLLRAGSVVAALPEVTDDLVIEKAEISRVTFDNTTNDLKVQYAQRYGILYVYMVGIGGTYLTQFIHMSDGRTFAHGYGDWIMGCCGTVDDQWADDRCSGNLDGQPRLICSPSDLSGRPQTIPLDLVETWGDSWNDCAYHLSKSGEAFHSGDEDIYCRGGCPHQGFIGRTVPLNPESDGWWTPRWYDQWPCGYWNNWLEEPYPMGGGDDWTWADEVERDYRPVVMFKENKHFVKVVGMGHGGVAIDANGKLWTWGYGGWGIVGRSDWEYDNTNWQCDPYNLMPDWNFIDCAGGYFHSCAVRDDGTLWVWGENWYDQLGVGAAYTGSGSYVYPTQVPTQEKFIKCWAPHEQTIAMTAGGEVWYTGSYFMGQFGNGMGQGDIPGLTHCTVYLSQIDWNDPFNASWYPGYLNNGMTRGGGGRIYIDFCAGSNASIGIIGDGEVWVWGFDQGSGVLGLGDNGTWCRNIPVQLNLPPCRKCWTDGTSMMVITEDDEVYWWGELSDQTFYPTKIDFDFFGTMV